MLLRRLRETFPALFSGYESPRMSFESYAEKIRFELIRLKRHPVRIIHVDTICPLDFLSLFRPERRMAVLTGQIEYSDWRYAAAVRLASLMAGPEKRCSQTAFEQRISQWENNPVIRSANGLPGWVRNVFTGKAAGPDEKELQEKTVWNGTDILHFLKTGGTSLVYAAECDGKPCVLKVPRPGCEMRFRHELAVLRGLHHPNLPEVFACSTDGTPYCVLEFCRTGQCVRKSGKITEFLHALKQLHASGWLHGDIRTANLGIRSDGTPVLLDFSHSRGPGSCRETELEMNKMKKCLLLT